MLKEAVKAEGLEAALAGKCLLKVLWDREMKLPCSVLLCSSK